MYDTRAVPWEYPSSGIGAVTRSGRFYAPKDGEKEKKAVTEDEARQVLEAVRTSEFEVVDQLRKMPAQISLLELFRSSEKHRDALMRVLNEVHVPETINETQLEDFVGAILLKDQISFSDEDFPDEGRSHNRALYVAVRCLGKEIARVLVDNGSAFNLCPLSTLRRLGKDKAIIPSQATIRAFDGMRKEVIGEIELEVTIGPTKFLIDFHVVDIPSAFNFLLGRPWIHMAGAVPSSLHQSVKFVDDGKLITVHGEVEFRAYAQSAVPYVGPQRVEEASYHSLELVHVVHNPVGSIIRAPDMSKSAIMTGKLLMEYGYHPGQGLGKNAQGIVEPIAPVVKRLKGRVGYRGESSGSKDGCGRGRGGRGSQGGRMMNHAAWKGKTIEAPCHDIPLSYTFPGLPKMLDEDEALSDEEDVLAMLCHEELVNVVIAEMVDHPLIK